MNKIGNPIEPLLYSLFNQHHFFIGDEVTLKISPNISSMLPRKQVVTQVIPATIAGVLQLPCLTLFANSYYYYNSP
jgi:hypothetical protein